MIRMLTSTILWDIRLQYRQGLYAAAAIVIVVWVGILSLLAPEYQALFLPFAIYMDLSVFGMYFMAGMLFLERGERVLEALVVTPLPRYGYLLAKSTSLTLLSILLSVLLVLILWGPHLRWELFIAGVGLNSWFLIQVGFILAARYNGISDFILPSMIFIAPSQLPLLYYFGIWDHWLLYILPVHGAMLLIEGAFQPPAAWQILYSVAYLSLSALFVTWWAQRTYNRFVVRAEGSR